MDGEQIDSTKQEVQLGYGGHIQLDANAYKARITGVIRFPYAADGSTWASCGATFISPHHAITAAHCVPKNKFNVDNNDSYNAGDHTFVVQQFSVDDLWNRSQAGDTAVTLAFFNSMTVTGTWPNYNQPNKMACSTGYCITGHYSQCRVRRRCSSTYGNENCPSSITSRNGGSGVDIALIHCADRPQLSAYGTVYPGADTVGQTMDVHWYHELVNLSTQPNDGIGPAGNFDHYGRYDQSDTGPYGKFNNYHYRKGSSLQLFPLVSKSFPNGTLYKNVSAGTDIMWTEAFGCHGTSGSGAFPSGTDYRLFGPIVLGASSMSGRLCNNSTQMGPGIAATAYVRPHITRILESLGSWDR